MSNAVHVLTDILLDLEEEGKTRLLTVKSRMHQWSGAWELNKVRPAGERMTLSNAIDNVEMTRFQQHWPAYYKRKGRFVFVMWNDDPAREPIIARILYVVE